MAKNMYYIRHSNAKDVMYKNLQKLLENEAFKDKRVYMFGTSKIASMIISWLQKNGIQLEGIIDNDIEKQGYKIAGLMVERPESLVGRGENVMVLIASSYQNEMAEQIVKIGYTEKNIIKVIDLPELMEDYSFIDRADYQIMPEREIRERQLDIMKYLKKVCDENNIDYYLAYGTLLGAVRHSGFIPWDDDVDVYVKGEEMDRLAELINKSEHYEIITCRNCSSYYDQIALLVDKNSVVDLNCFPLQATTGISIDVFPLYGLPSDQRELSDYVEKLKQLEIQKWNSLYDEEACHKAALELNDYISSYRFADSEYTGFFLSPYFTKDYLKTDFFAEKSFLMYEDEEFCVPGQYKEVLNVIYGDFMKLPPENRRGGRHYYKAYYPNCAEKQKKANERYWNHYYNGNLELDYPSNFARYIANQLQMGTVLVDLGCGNGRDSLYFEKMGMKVIAIDMSQTVISKLKKEYGDKNIQFYQGDFVNDSKLYSCEPDYFYSRFTIHAINEQQQDTLIKNVYEQLKSGGGKFYIEVRSVLDDIYGLGEEIARNTYIYEGHSRRFIVRKELEQQLEKQGFDILYSEEGRHFAPFKDQDPIVLRIIAEKK